jgi:hypothetical protein
MCESEDWHLHLSPLDVVCPTDTQREPRGPRVPTAESADFGTRLAVRSTEGDKLPLAVQSCIRLSSTGRPEDAQEVGSDYFSVSAHLSLSLGSRRLSIFE